jgi:hypothetical protein
MNKRSIAIILAFIMILATNSTIFANNGNGNGNSDEDTGESSTTDSAAPDPGVSSGQDDTKTSTIKWILPHGDTYIIDDAEVNIVLDWESLDITSEREVGNGNVTFIGIGGTSDDSDSSSSSCGNGNGRGNCSCSCDNDNNGNGNGNGSGGGPLPSSDCGSVWVTPGAISASARQIAPEYAVVVNQDPEENGVTIEWHISIAPTTVSYEKWKIVGHRHVACVEDDTKGNDNSNGNDECPKGWHPVIEHIWACAVTTKTYKEGIDELVAGASLTLDSRAWINGELADAYPGATLQHPDWGIAQTPTCIWNGDVCSWDFTANIPVVDPGWYDIKLSGATAGTRVSPARSFDITSGEFGVYLLDNTAMTQ